MVKMVNFILRVFYKNKQNQEEPVGGTKWPQVHAVGCLLHALGTSYLAP